MSQGIAITTLRAAWGAVENAIAYEAEWRKNNGNWVSVSRTSALGFEVPGIYAGRYRVRVRAINASNVSSIWATSMETYLKGKRVSRRCRSASRLRLCCGVSSSIGDLTGPKTR